MSHYRIYLLPFSHLDLFWLGQREECLSRGGRIIASALAIMRRHPEFRFLLEDVVFIDEYLDCHPEQAQELRAQVQAGRLEIGTKWAGVYQHWQPEESMVRNLLYGKQRARDRLGADPDTVHMGDLPGYIPQYPQVLAKSGIKGLVICRGGPTDQVLFRWRAPDGSNVLAWNALPGYGWAWRMWLHRSVDLALRERERRGRVHPPLDEEARQMMALTAAPILMHWGTDLTVPTEKLVDNVREWNTRLDLPMRFSTLSEYLDAVQAVPDIPTLSGEIVSVWPGMEAAEAGFFYLSGPANYALMQGENWCALVRWLGLGDYDAKVFAAAWKLLLQGMDHNWGGTGGADTDRRHREYLLSPLLTGQEACRKATRQIAENVKLPQVEDITPIVVFNPTSWSRTDLVSAHASFYGEVAASYRPGSDYGDAFECLRLYDHTGQEVPFQYLDRQAPITREATICFTAQDVPPFGYRLYYLAPAAEDAPESPCCLASGLEEGPKAIVESARFRLEIERPTGRVSLYDKVLGMSLATGMELVAYEDDPSEGFGDRRTSRVFPNAIDKIELAENGVARARVCITGRIGDSRTLQEWIIPCNLDYVQVIDHITWGSHPSRIYVQRVIPTGIEAPVVTYGVPFGTNDWEGYMPNSGPHLRDEYPIETVRRTREPLHWLDVSGARGGVTIATERHTLEREESTLRIALLHAGNPRRPLVVPWGDGHLVTRTRLRGHVGDWRRARAYRDGLALYWPLFAVSVADPLSPKRLEPVASLCDIGAENIILTTLKRAERGDGTIVRGFEVEGKETRATPRLAGVTGRFSEVNLLEEQPYPLEGESIWHPYEIKTLMLEALT